MGWVVVLSLVLVAAIMIEVRVWDSGQEMGYQSVEKKDMEGWPWR